MNPSMIRYIKEANARGYSANEIRKFLLSKKYNRKNVEEAIILSKIQGKNLFNRRPPAKPKTIPKKKEIKFKKRNPIFVLLLFIFTFGIYHLIWTIKTTRELQKNNVKSQPKIRIILYTTLIALLISIVFLISTNTTIQIIFGILAFIINMTGMFIFWAKYANAVEETTNLSALTTLLLMIFLSPAGATIIQMKFNEKSNN